MRNYKELIVWQKSVDLVTKIFRKKKCITLQIRYDVLPFQFPLTFPEVIQEDRKKDYLQFLKIAQRSYAELETQLLISKNLNYLNSEKFKNLHSEPPEISKIINTIISKFKQSHS